MRSLYFYPLQRTLSNPSFSVTSQFLSLATNNHKLRFSLQDDRHYPRRLARPNSAVSVQEQTSQICRGAGWFHLATIRELSNCLLTSRVPTNLSRILPSKKIWGQARFLLITQPSKRVLGLAQTKIPRRSLKRSQKPLGAQMTWRFIARCLEPQCGTRKEGLNEFSQEHPHAIQLNDLSKNKNWR